MYTGHHPMSLPIITENSKIFVVNLKYKYFLAMGAFNYPLIDWELLTTKNEKNKSV